MVSRSLELDLDSQTSRSQLTDCALAVPITTGNQSRELRNRRVTMLAEDSTTSASRRKQKGKQKEKGGKKVRLVEHCLGLG